MTPAHSDGCYCRVNEVFLLGRQWGRSSDQFRLDAGRGQGAKNCSAERSLRLPGPYVPVEACRCLAQRSWGKKPSRVIQERVASGTEK